MRLFLCSSALALIESCYQSYFLIFLDQIWNKFCPDFIGVDLETTLRIYTFQLNPSKGCWRSKFCSWVRSCRRLMRRRPQRQSFTSK